MKSIIRATSHAQGQLLKRGISLTECELVLNDAYAEHDSLITPGGKVIYGEAYGRRIKIFVLPLGADEYELKSAASPDE